MLGGLQKEGAGLNAAWLQCTGLGGPALEGHEAAASDAERHGRQVCPADHLQGCTLPQREGGRVLPGVLGQPPSADAQLSA